jgi:phage shock protein E
MNLLSRSLAFIAVLAISHIEIRAQEQQQIPNPKIDYPGFLRDAGEVGKLRKERRVTEAQFIEMSAEAGTVILDARSAEKYRMLHVRGAKNLSLPDITAAELARIIPAKATRVLIYCNNNFENEERAFPSKAARVSLNIYTFNTLYGYGYRNVYELGPLIDIKATKLFLEGENLFQVDPLLQPRNDLWTPIRLR